MVSACGTSHSGNLVIASGSTLVAIKLDLRSSQKQVFFCFDHDAYTIVLDVVSIAVRSLNQSRRFEKSMTAVFGRLRLHRCRRESD